MCLRSSLPQRAQIVAAALWEACGRKPVVLAALARSLGARVPLRLSIISGTYASSHHTKKEQADGRHVIDRAEDEERGALCTCMTGGWLRRLPGWEWSEDRVRQCHAHADMCRSARTNYLFASTGLAIMGWENV